MKIRVPHNGGIHIVGQAKEPTVAFGYPYGPISQVFKESCEALYRRDVVRMAGGKPAIVRHIIAKGGIYVDHNRNEIAERFFRTDAEWLLQVDTDIQFPDTLVETLLERAGRDKKVLAASVPLGPPLDSCAWMLTAIPGVWACLPGRDITPEGIECDGLATAIILIHRDVIQAIADREGQCWFLKRGPVPRLDDARSKAAWVGEGPIADRRYIPQGEDLSFSLRAKDAGFKLWCCKVEGLRHYKTLPLTHDFEDPQVEAAGETPTVLEAAG